MNKNAIILLVVVLVAVGGFVYYQQHTHTSTLDLPGNHSISVTTHD
ncbi:MAG: hypothetical protein WDN72_06785 [Alphaproteobacteria bacterium]